MAEKNAPSTLSEQVAEKRLIQLNLRITKATLVDGVVKWHAQAASDEGREGETELLDPSLFDDLANTFDMIQEAMAAGEELPSFGNGVANEPILDFSHYTADLDPEFRNLARAGPVTQLYRDGRYLHAGGEFDATDLGQLAAQAALDDEVGKIRVSVGFWPDWGNIVVKDDILYYMGGRNLAYLDHLALTTVPRIPGTTFVAEVTMSDKTVQTAAEDMAEILGPEGQPFIDEIESRVNPEAERRSMVIKSESDEQVNSPDEGTPSEEVPSEPVVVVPVVESTVETVVEEPPVAPVVEVEPVVESETPVAEVAPILESETADEPVLEAAVVNECEVWKPFGGATSFDDAVAVVEAEKELGRLYDGMYVFEEVLWNIMNDEEISDKRAAMGQATEDFQKFINSDTSLWSSIIAKRSEIAEVEAEPVEVEPTPSEEPEPQELPVIEQPLVAHTQSPDRVVEQVRSEPLPPEASPISVVNGEAQPTLKRVASSFKEALGMMENMPTQDRRRAVPQVMATTEAELTRAVGGVNTEELAMVVAAAMGQAMAPVQAALQDVVSALNTRPEVLGTGPAAPLRRSRAPVPNILPAKTTTQAKTFSELFIALQQPKFR